MSTPILEVRNLSKSFGRVRALQDVSCAVRSGEVLAVLGDNGAGKSTLIKALSGVHSPDGGEFLVDGEPTRFHSPRSALDHGIATVYQDLALAPLMSVWRNFFLGSEPTKRGLITAHACKAIAVDELGKMGIEIRDPEQAVGTLSGGERQCLAIARSVYFGARLLILDEPTAALGVRQSGMVLKYVVQARERGLGVIFITHNPNHAYLVSDRFMLLQRGRTIGHYAQSETSIEQLAQLMAGGAELAALEHEISSIRNDE